jgi:hypothetical protein
MANFVNRIEERRESDRQLSHVNYDGFRRMGYLRAFTVRLPITTIAKMDLLEKKCSKVWDSKQEMFFEMIESCIADWIASTDSPEAAHAEFQEAAHRSLQQHSLDRDRHSAQKAPEEI